MDTSTQPTSDWVDEGSAFAEDIYEDEGDGIVDFLGEPRICGEGD